MNDFQISPELVVMCAKDIQVYYDGMFQNSAAKIFFQRQRNIKRRWRDLNFFQGSGECKDKGDGGRTIHCLMNLAYKGKLASGDECEEELKLLLKESNPLDSGDWRLDPVLQRACQVSTT